MADADQLAAPSINWVIGPSKSAGWAYGNNARRLASRLGAYRHAVNHKTATDIAVFFDARVAKRYLASARVRVLRIGGPRPLDHVYGNNVEKMRKGLERFDAVIALSPALTRRVSHAYPGVIFVPNGLDLSQWRPGRCPRRSNSAFTAGFAAGVRSGADRFVK